MGKVSSYSYDTTPGLTDYFLGNSASGPTTKKFKIEDVINSAISPPWQSYTPTTTNLTPGNGSIVGKYRQVGKKIDFDILFTLGSTSALSTAPTFGLPVSANSRYNTFTNGYELSIGQSTMTDSSVAECYFGTVALKSSTVCQVIPMRGDATWVYSQNVIAATQPASSWGPGDTIWLTGSYEAA